jgi:hypothetical protein
VSTDRRFASCSRITSGPGVEPLPALGQCHNQSGPAQHQQPGTQEIASLNYLSVLVFFHFIKLAFTIGIESSFQVVEIPNQWLHFLSSSSNRCFFIGYNDRHIWTGSRSLANGWTRSPTAARTPGRSSAGPARPPVLPFKSQLMSNGAPKRLLIRRLHVGLCAVWRGWRHPDLLRPALGRRRPMARISLRSPQLLARSASRTGSRSG